MGQLGRFIASQISSALFLCVLGGLFYWGHFLKWKLPQGASPHHSSLKDVSESKTVSRDMMSIAVEGDVTAPVSYRGDETGHRALTIRFPSLQAVQKAGLEVIQVMPRSMDQDITAHGQVDYDRVAVAQLATRVPGTVWRVEKHVGERVRKGDVLVVVDALEVGKAKSELLEALVVLDLRTKVAQRLQGAASSVPARQIQEAETAMREARIRLINAQQRLMNLGLRQINVTDLAGLPDEEIFRRGRVLGLPEALVGELQSEATAANLIPLIAPFDGLVISREAVVGEQASPAQPQIIIADTSRMWLMLDVRLEDADRLRLGQNIQFQPDVGAPLVVRSKIDWIGTEIDPKTRTLSVRGTVENPDGKLRSHLFGTGRIQIREAPEALAIPVHAVQQEGTTPFVFVKLTDSLFELRAVQTGIERDGYTEVTRGLTEGELIVTTGSHLLKSEVTRRRMIARNQDRRHQ